MKDTLLTILTIEGIVTLALVITLLMYYVVIKFKTTSYLLKKKRGLKRFFKRVF